MTETLASLVVMALVLSITPGPNNVLLTASGARVGWARTTPAQAGILLGFVTQILACALGLGALLTGTPSLRVVLAGFASAYMAWLGRRLWGAATPGTADADPGLAWWRFTALQYVNPKTWLANVAFVSGYLEAGPVGGAARVGLTVVFLVVVTTSMTVWTLFGVSLRSRLQDHWTVVNRALAVLAVATIPTFWLP